MLGANNWSTLDGQAETLSAQCNAKNSTLRRLQKHSKGTELSTTNEPNFQPTSELNFNTSASGELKLQLIRLEPSQTHLVLSSFPKASSCRAVADPMHDPFKRWTSNDKLLLGN